jgi:hypothetical protein
MGLFSKQTDEEFHQKIIKEAEAIMKKAYDLPVGQSQFPSEANIVSPDKLFGVSYEKVDNSNIRINIGYKTNHSGYVRQGLRMSYEIVKKGSILCSEVISFNEISYNPKSSIDKAFLSNVKTLTCPIGKTKSIEVKCKKIYLESAGMFVMHDGRLITHREFLEIMSR